MEIEIKIYFQFFWEIYDIIIIRVVHFHTSSNSEYKCQLTTSVKLYIFRSGVKNINAVKRLLKRSLRAWVKSRY